MRFALAFDHGDWARGKASSETLALAQRADDGGIDSLWLSEDPDGWDAFAVLAAISQQTQHIQLGTGVVNPYHRNPNQIAASVATLDRLAPGRVFLGLGRGQPEWYGRALGMEIGSPLERLRETISLLRQWEASGTASIDGAFRIDAWTRVIQPSSRVPIYLAAAGPRSLELTGQIADGVLFNFLATPDFISGATAHVRAAAIAAGRDPAALHFIANPGVTITENPEPVWRARKRFVASVLALPGMEVLLENPELDVPAIMRQVRSAMKTDEILARGGAFSDFAKEGDLAAAMAAIPDALTERGSAVGSLAAVRERLGEFAAAGVTDVVLGKNGLPADAAGIRDLIGELRTAT